MLNVFCLLSMIKPELIAKAYLFLLFVSVFTGCSTPHSVLPETETFQPPPEFSMVLVGEGRAYRFSDGAWIEVPSYNYEFTVLQRRYTDRWESIKEIHRRHPQYDGRAGNRDQTLYFLISFLPGSGKSLEFSADTSLGKGLGKADPEFKNLAVELKPDISRFAPFSNYRITQTYKYEDGYLKEIVELFKKKDDIEEPFMKIEEEAIIYLSQKLQKSS